MIVVDDVHLNGAALSATSPVFEQGTVVVVLVGDDYFDITVAEAPPAPPSAVYVH